MPGPASTFPVAVILNRFFTDDLVFTLGISVSLLLAPIPSRKVPGVGRSRPGMPIRSPGARTEGRAYSGGSGAMQGWGCLLPGGDGLGRRVMPTRIGIAGITGRMGHLLAEEVRAAGAELAGGVGRTGSGKPAPA